MILERVHPEDIPSANMAITAANRGEGIELELRLLMPDGRIKYLHVIGEAESRETGFPPIEFSEQLSSQYSPDLCRSHD